MSAARRSLMLLSNAYRPDPRVQREAWGLLDRGYRVTVLCWDREGKLPAEEMDRGVEIRRVQDVRTGYARGWRQMRHFPRFWRRCVEFARRQGPDVIHCHDLDTLYAGWRTKRSIGCPLLYDAHEHYPAQMSLYLPNLMILGLARWERWLLRKTDAIVTASTVLRDDYRAMGMENVRTVGNYSPLAPFEDVEAGQVAAERRRLGIGDGTLAVGYVGGFHRNRLFEPFLAAAGERPAVQFHLWGDGPQRRRIEAASARQANVTYHGWLEHTRMPTVFKAMDVIYYGLRQDYAGARYNAPNTLAQAMAAGRPIIAADVGDLGRIVRETGCGLLLGAPDARSIAGAIDALVDPAMRRRLGENGLHSARDRYNLTAMHEQLVEVYERLQRPD